MFPPRGRRCLPFGVAAVCIAWGCTPPVAGSGAAPPLPTAAGETTTRGTRGSGPLLTDADRAMGIEWRFDAGGTIHAPPATGADGSVYVGTGDGYVLALGTDGRVSWSYTLEGAVAWAPVVDPSGRIYVATTAQRLCSFQPGGALGWQVRTPAHVASELSLTGSSGVLFAGTDGNVWAYAAHGSPIWHASIGGTVSAGPRVFGTHAVVGVVDGVVLELDGAVRKRAIRLDQRSDGIVAANPDGSIAVLVGGALVGLGAAGEVRFRREGVAWAEATSSGFVAAERGGIVTRLGPDGAVLSSAPYGGTASAAPVLAPSGAIYVPEGTGVLSVVASDGSTRHVPIARAALHRPLVDVAHRRIVVTAGDGIVAALREE